MEESQELSKNNEYKPLLVNNEFRREKKRQSFYVNFKLDSITGQTEERYINGCRDFQITLKV